MQIWDLCILVTKLDRIDLSQTTWPSSVTDWLKTTPTCADPGPVARVVEIGSQAMDLGLFGSFVGGVFRTARIGVIRSIGLTLLK